MPNLTPQNNFVFVWWAALPMSLVTGVTVPGAFLLKLFFVFGLGGTHRNCGDIGSREKCGVRQASPLPKASQGVRLHG